MMRKILLISSVFLLFFPIITNAEIKTITVTHSYKMGDNDSRNEARRLCLLEAKRNLLEQAKAYIGSQEGVKNNQLSKEELSAYSAAILKAETINEKWIDMTVTMTVKTVVDSDYSEKLLSRIKRDTSLQNEFKKQQKITKELEKTITLMQKQLQSADIMEADPLRKERNVAINQIDSLEAKKIEIIEGIHKRSRDAIKNITTKMTMKNVREALGQPDAKAYEKYLPHKKNYYVWYYGYSRIYFNQTNMVIVID